MNNYSELSKLYYQKVNIEEELRRRLENPCVYKIRCIFCQFYVRKEF